MSEQCACDAGVPMTRMGCTHQNPLKIPLPEFDTGFARGVCKEQWCIPESSGRFKT